MTCTENEKVCYLRAILIPLLVLTYLALIIYTDSNLPKLSIEEFSVPVFNKTSDHISGNVFFDVKLRNMNKAIGLYIDDPFNLAFSYYPIDEPRQKYVWEYTVPAFYQGNGKTYHIGNHLGPPSTVVDEEEEDSQESYKHARRLLVRSHVELETNSTVVETELSSPAVAAEVVCFRVDLRLNYRFKFWFDNDRHVLELGGDVVVDANSGERVSKGSVLLVESAAAAAAGGPVMVVVLFTSFLLMSM